MFFPGFNQKHGDGELVDFGNREVTLQTITGNFKRRKFNLIERARCPSGFFGSVFVLIVVSDTTAQGIQIDGFTFLFH